MFSQKLYPLIALIFAITVITACGTQEEPEVNLPDAGEITIYTSLNEEQTDIYLAAFQKEYPNINVNLVSDSTGIIISRLLSEREDPQADVVWALVLTGVSLLEWYELLEPYEPADMDRIAPQFIDTSNPPYWVGTDALMSTICVNPEEAEKLGLPIPESWEDMLNPDYQGHVVMPNPNSSGTGFMAVSALVTLYGEAGAWEYMDKLHQNIDYYTSSGSKPCRLVGAGEKPFGISYGYEGATQRASGNSVEMIFPVEGTGWDIKANALVKKDDTKLAAQTFLDWAVGDTAMHLYAQDRGLTSAKTDQPPPDGFPEDPASHLIDTDHPWMAANRGRLVSEWSERYSDKLEPSN